MKHKELADQAGLITNQDTEENNQEYINDLERFAELVRADEREANAKLCEDLQLTDLRSRDWADGTYDCANAIRARGNT
jgi:hypothetical protein